jgi:hypothetical protein
MTGTGSVVEVRCFHGPELVGTPPTLLLWTETDSVFETLRSFRIQDDGRGEGKMTFNILIFRVLENR